MASQKKKDQLQQLAALLEKTPHFTLIKHDKTKHTALETLRKELKKNGSSLQVAKNSIFEKAVKSIAKTNPSMKSFIEKAFPVKENSAVISFSDDWSKGLSAFYRYSEKDQSVSFKVGILDNTVYTSSDLTKIAKLPSRPELTAKLIGTMKSPIYSFVYNLKYNMQKLVFVLKAKKG